jgi:hypothetical protein
MPRNVNACFFNGVMYLNNVFLSKLNYPLNISIESLHSALPRKLLMRTIRLPAGSSRK